MTLEVLIVPDKFKGTLTAHAAAELIAQGWREIRPQDRVHVIPMSDGGDGFGEVLAELLHLEPATTLTVDAAHRPLQSTWWRNLSDKTCVIESARVVGLAQLPPKKYHPFELDTFGLGSLFDAAIQEGATQGLMGIGGSATNDGGFGMARALGWRFLDPNENPITRWTELIKLARIIPPTSTRRMMELTVAVDVQNPLLGPTGASRIYGPQKGLRTIDFALAEECLDRMASVVLRDLGIDAANQPGAGAAGGLGFGLHSFLQARLEPGFNVFASCANLENRIRTSDVVLTGEGAIDRSTLMGKGVGEIARLCQKHGVLCLGLAGTLAISPEDDNLSGAFASLRGMAPDLTTSDQAQREPQVWLPRLAALAARQMPL